ncbi:MAG: NFACT family protein [Oscillospiraceae bacterium]|nr:NFACT family protein [Oscillospiraceae bacterium]
MPIDAFFLTALAGELDETLRGARADKIHQPSDCELLIALRGPNGAARLLIAAGGGTPRAHITAISRENPTHAPMFCMLLRKHLTSARLRAVRQVPLERILEFEWDTRDEMGVPSVKFLIVELMGRNSNIALAAEEEGNPSARRVLDCLRRGGLDSPRPIQAGMFYRPPENRDAGKADPLSVTREAFDRLREARRDAPPEDFLTGAFAGFSPLLAREITLEDGTGDLAGRFFAHTDRLRERRFAPYILRGADGAPKDFYSVPLRQYGSLYTCEAFDGTFSQLLDAVCGEKEQAARLGQCAAELRKPIKTQLARLRKKLLLQAQTLEESRDRERFRRWGDLLMANLHRMEEARGRKSITVDDFYGAPGDTADIPLDKTKNLQQNAAQYYTKYRKLKHAASAVAAQMEAARADLGYWESVSEALSRAESRSEIDEIRGEILPEKLRAKPGRRPPKADVPAKAQLYISSEGVPFRVGRNNRQNDELTTRQAGRNDIWLHAQKVPGCHVVIDTSGGTPPGDQTLLEAATAAALYSAAAENPKAAVDYTRVKHVKKPPGAKPGMVIYHEFQTILVKPDQELIKNLLKNDK